MNFPLALALMALQTQALDLPKKHLNPKPGPEVVMAAVGGVAIKASDIESYLWDWRAHEVVQDLVTYRMIAAEAAKQKIAITDAEVQRELDSQMEQVKKELKEGQTVEQHLLERGFPKSRLFLRIKTEELLNRLVLKTFEPKNYVKVSTLIVRARTEQAAELAQALQRAENAYTALKTGEPWADVLARFTDEPGTLQNQGLLGWRELKAFPPTVQEEMATLKRGGFTKPAATAGGIQIFRIEAVGAGAEGPVLQELKDAYLFGSRQKYLDDLRGKTKIDIFVGK